LLGRFEGLLGFFVFIAVNSVWKKEALSCLMEVDSAKEVFRALWVLFTPYKRIKYFREVRY
jgi:hypothetical protein